MTLFQTLLLASTLGWSVATTPTDTTDGQQVNTVGNTDCEDLETLSLPFVADFATLTLTSPTSHGSPKPYMQGNNGTYYNAQNTTSGYQDGTLNVPAEVVQTMHTQSKLIVPTMTDDARTRPHKTICTCITVTMDAFPTYYSPRVQETEASLDVPEPHEQTFTASLRKPQTKYSQDSLVVPGTSTTQVGQTNTRIIVTTKTQAYLAITTIKPKPTDKPGQNGGGGVVIITQAPKTVYQNVPAKPAAGGSDHKDGDDQPVTIIVQPHHQIPESVLASIMESLYQQYGAKGTPVATTKTHYIVGETTVLPGSTAVVIHGTTYSIAERTQGSGQGVVYVNGQPTPATAVPGFEVRYETSTATVTESGSEEPATSQSTTSAQRESQTVVETPSQTSASVPEQATNAAARLGVSAGCAAVLMGVMAMF